MALRNVKVTGVEPVLLTNLQRMMRGPNESKFKVHYHLTPIVPKAKANGTWILYWDCWAMDEIDAWKKFKEAMRLAGREVVS